MKVAHVPALKSWTKSALERPCTCDEREEVSDVTQRRVQGGSWSCEFSVGLDRRFVSGECACRRTLRMLPPFCVTESVRRIR